MIKRLLTLFLSLVLGVSLSGALAGTALADDGTAAPFWVPPKPVFELLPGSRARYCFYVLDYITKEPIRYADGSFADLINDDGKYGSKMFYINLPSGMYDHYHSVDNLSYDKETGQVCSTVFYGDDSSDSDFDFVLRPNGDDERLSPYVNGQYSFGVDYLAVDRYERGSVWDYASQTAFVGDDYFIVDSDTGLPSVLLYHPKPGWSWDQDNHKWISPPPLNALPMTGSHDVLFALTCIAVAAGAVVYLNSLNRKGGDGHED